MDGPFQSVRPLTQSTVAASLLGFPEAAEKAGAKRSLTGSRVSSPTGTATRMTGPERRRCRSSCSWRCLRLAGIIVEDNSTLITDHFSSRDRHGRGPGVGRGRAVGADRGVGVGRGVTVGVVLGVVVAVAVAVGVAVAVAVIVGVAVAVGVVVAVAVAVAVAVGVGVGPPVGDTRTK